MLRYTQIRLQSNRLCEGSLTNGYDINALWMSSQYTEGFANTKHVLRDPMSAESTSHLWVRDHFHAIRKRIKFALSGWYRPGHYRESLSDSLSDG